MSLAFPPFLVSWLQLYNAFVLFVLKGKKKWPQFKEDYYNRLGQQYDKILVDVEKEKAEGFWGYMK